jgi:hypothetical protein
MVIDKEKDQLLALAAAIRAKSFCPMVCNCPEGDVAQSDIGAVHGGRSQLPGVDSV